MRKNVAEKTAKDVDAKPSSVAGKPAKTAKPAGSAPSAKATKAAGVSRVAKSVPPAEPPRVSLATLAAMNTTSNVAKVRKTAQAAKVPQPVKTDKVPRAVKLAKEPKAAKVTEAAKVEMDSVAMDAAIDPNAANGKRTLRGIKLARHLGAVATDASLVLAEPVEQAAPVTPAAPPSLKPVLKARPAGAKSVPRNMPPPSFLAGIWAFLRNPPGVTLTGLAALTVALGVLALTQDGIPGEAPTAAVSWQSPAMTGPNDALFPAPFPDDPGAFPPAPFPPFPATDYGSHYPGRFRY